MCAFYIVPNTIAILNTFFYYKAITTMRQKILNAIIAFSLVGILAISIKNAAFSKNQPSASVTPSTTPNQNTQYNDPKISCSNRYFAFEKGTRWRYAITTAVATQEGKKTEKDFFTAVITTASASSITIESRYDSAKNEPVTTELTCRKSGIYGIPFPFLQSMELDFLTQSVSLFPPDRPLKKNDVWIFTLPTFATVRNTINNQDAGRIQVTADVVFTDQTLNAFNDLTDALFTYSLEEGRGVTDFSLDIHLQEVVRYTMTLKLLDFTPTAS